MKMVLTPRDQLDYRLTEMLFEMELLMGGDVPSPDAGPKGQPGPVIPGGTSMADKYREMLVHVLPYEFRKLNMILMKGTEELLGAKYGPGVRARKEPRNERADRIVLMYKGWNPSEVAVAEQCSEGFVRKLRSERGVDPSDGSYVS